MTNTAPLPAPVAPGLSVDELSRLQFPQVIYVGIKVGEWPLTALVNEDQAARWLSESTGINDRRRNLVRIDLLSGEVTQMRALTIPQKHTLLTSAEYEAHSGLTD